MTEYVATYENSRTATLRHRKFTAPHMFGAMSKAVVNAYANDRLVGIRENDRALFPDLPTA